MSRPGSERTIVVVVSVVVAAVVASIAWVWFGIALPFAAGVAADARKRWDGGPPPHDGREPFVFMIPSSGDGGRWAPAGESVDAGEKPPL
jgi:hypothetical protein